ncbi:phage tail tube protein [Hydrogenophaga sp.]|uniref:phage tail tube protein n=1 Tax=Hydrogenophaga sp. TaxID=1904254 RepID=UPI003D0FAAC7
MKLMRNMLVMAKAQVAQGTPATLAAADDAMLVRSAMPSPIKAEFVDRALVRPYMGNSPKLVAGEHAAIEFEMELAGSGAAGTAPAFAPLLLASGFSETILAATHALYEPVTTGQVYLTLACNLDGLQFLLTDVIADVSCDMNPKGIPVLKFMCMGVYNAYTDTAMPAGADFTAFLKPLTVGRTNTPTFTLHGTTPCVEQFSWALNNENNWRELINCSGARRSDRKPTANAVIELPTAAAKNWGEAVRLGDVGALSVVHGLVAGNIVQIDMPTTTVASEPSISDSQGIAMLNLQLDVNPDEGNDELVLTFK